MARVFLNPGHCPGVDPGAGNASYSVNEADIVREIGALVADYLSAAGCEVKVLQSNNLAGEDSSYPNICGSANNWPADIFVSLHCNSAQASSAKGTEVLVYSRWSKADKLANCILNQIVDSLETVNRGVKERPGLVVLNSTNMTAVLVELAFISNDADCRLLMMHKDDFARAVARGITDYLQERGV